jgi:GNAT superfamily N-acetyltransferase
MSDEPRPIEVVPASADRWGDVALLLDGDGEVGCWCQPWRGDVAKGESRPDALRRQMASSAPPPGFVAYVDGKPAGWVGVTARSIAPRLRNSRTLPAIDDADVWAIGCFRIRPGYRRRGVARALLDGVVDAASEAGAPGVEAYPIDPEGRRVEVGAGFVGIASMFDKAGFHRVRATDGHSGRLTRIHVRLDFERQSGTGTRRA